MLGHHRPYQYRPLRGYSDRFLITLAGISNRSYSVHPHRYSLVKLCPQSLMSLFVHLFRFARHKVIQARANRFTDGVVQSRLPALA